MSDSQEPCLAASEILAYLSAELTEGRKAEVARHLDDCQLCAAAVEGVAGLEEREDFRKSAGFLLAAVRARTVVVPPDGGD